MNPRNHTTRASAKQQWVDDAGRPMSAEQVFRSAQMPSTMRSRRVLTEGSEIDSWKRKRGGQR